MEFVVLDIETTGLSPRRNKIIEIGAMKFSDKDFSAITHVDTFHSLINPEMRIPPFIISLTGIDNEMTKGKPLISQVLRELQKFLGPMPIIAHNASFDCKFIDHSYRAVFGYPLLNQPICTCKIARRLMPYLPSKSLGSIGSHLKIVNTNAHRALGDTSVTAQIFLHFLDELKKKEIDTIDKVIRYQKTRIVRDYC